MGSNRRREAIENGDPIENAAAVRRRRRQEAAIAREELALELYARGVTIAGISEALYERFEVRLSKNIMELVRRGLYRRVQDNQQQVEVAREMLLAQYRKLLEVYMPRALGDGPNDDDGNRPTPDTRAADLALRVLDKVGVVTGAVAPPRSGDINLAIINGGAPPDAADQRRVALANLARDREKLREIEGQLSNTPAHEGDYEDVEDGKVPLPTFLLPITPPED